MRPTLFTRPNFTVLLYGPHIKVTSLCEMDARAVMLPFLMTWAQCCGQSMLCASSGMYRLSGSRNVCCFPSSSSNDHFIVPWRRAVPLPRPSTGMWHRFREPGTKYFLLLDMQYDAPESTRSAMESVSKQKGQLFGGRRDKVAA